MRTFVQCRVCSYSLGKELNVFTGWGEALSVPAKTENSWGEPPSPLTAVDNGTSAWGKPPNGSSGWGDNTVELTGNFGRGNPPAAAPAMCKPGNKIGAIFFFCKCAAQTRQMLNALY